MALTKRDVMQKEILAKIVLLLESKHLYQSVEVDFREAQEAPLYEIPQPILMGGGSEATFAEQLITSYLNDPWCFVPEGRQPPSARPIDDTSKPIVTLVMPTIKISCNHCDAVLPAHNSGFKSLREWTPELTFPLSSAGEKIVQIFFLPFQCQSCRGEPLVFIVRRDGTKLQIVGRSQFEEVQVPKFISKQEREYYSNAVIAFQTGRTLAALFYLRTLVEQYFRRVLNTGDRVSGEDLSDRYAALLDDEFPKKFTSLKIVYQELSIKLHSAEKDEEQYAKSLREIERHFELLQNLPLKDLQPRQSAE